MGFQFWLKRSERERERERGGGRESSRSQVRCIERIYPPESFWPSSEHGGRVYGDGATQRDMGELYQRQSRSKWDLYCIECDCWLVAREDRRVKSVVGRFWSCADEASWAVNHYLNFLKENPRRASKGSSTMIIWSPERTKEKTWLKLKDSPPPPQPHPHPHPRL